VLGGGPADSEPGPGRSGSRLPGRAGGLERSESAAVRVTVHDHDHCPECDLCAMPVIMARALSRSEPGPLGVWNRRRAPESGSESCGGQPPSQAEPPAASVGVPGGMIRRITVPPRPPPGRRAGDTAGGSGAAARWNLCRTPSQACLARRRAGAGPGAGPGLHCRLTVSGRRCRSWPARRQPP
jgi:hypothetical protein